MLWPSAIFGVSLLLAGSAVAQSNTPGGMPPPPGMSLAASTAMRFPQKVTVGRLLRLTVQQPVESHLRIGVVDRLVRNGDGTIDVIIDAGGFIGFGRKPIAVPLNAMVLVGDVMEVVAYTPQQLKALPIFTPGATTALSVDTIVSVGLAKPSH